jgi:hypothetical protein
MALLKAGRKERAVGKRKGGSFILQGPCATLFDINGYTGVFIEEGQFMLFDENIGRGIRGEAVVFNKAMAGIYRLS